MIKRENLNKPEGILVKKKNGETELFKSSKLRGSLRNSGAAKKDIDVVMDHIEKELHNGVTTDWIYRHAFKELEKQASRAASFRYSLRRAIAELGPSGFPFEKFIGQIYQRDGYAVQVGVKLRGKCVTHEVDVLAENDTEIVTAELKFHNKPNLRSDLKTVLYVRERFRDIESIGFYGKKKKIPMVITNTKFSANAIKYAECSGLSLLGWNYPRKGAGLHDIIQNAQIHPVTAINSFSKKETKDLINAGFITCKDIKKNNGRDVLSTKIISKKKLYSAWKDIDSICGL